MKKLTKNIKETPADVAETKEPVTESEGTENPYLNSNEQEALTSNAPKPEDNCSKILDRSLAVVADTFNLAEGNFVLNGFKDTGKKITVSLSNSDFDLSVSIKDCEKYSIK